MSLALSHVMDFVLFLTSTNRGCWLFIHLIILVLLILFIVYEIYGTLLSDQ
jgi:hypothetical protein